MELKDFVSETLKQVIEGVKLAQEHTKEHGGQVNPSGMYATAVDKSSRLHGSRGEIVQIINFDVVVTTTESDLVKGGIGIFVGEIGIGVRGESKDHNSGINRIQFSVPIILPLQP